MAYRSGRGLGPADDMELPPDYDMDTLPNPSIRQRQQHQQGEFHGNGELPDHYHRHQAGYPDDYHAYHRGSGEFDNQAFDFFGTSGVHNRGFSPDPHDLAARDLPYNPRARSASPTFVNVDLEAGPAEGKRGASQPHHYNSTGDNQGFLSNDETDLNPTLRRRRRYWPRSRSRYERRSSKKKRSGEVDDDGGGYDSDNASVATLTPEDLQRMREFLATIRIRQRSRKRLHRTNSQEAGGEGDHDTYRREGPGDVDSESDEQYEELVGLPSAQANPKIKSLANRLAELRSANAAEVAKSLRESYTDIDPSLVASAAWRGWDRRKAQFADFFNTLDVWKSHFKEIEGRFGGATASYFRFTRWLVFLNFFTFLITILVIFVPFFATSKPSRFGESVPAAMLVNNSFLTGALNCSATYEQTIEDFISKEEVQQKVLDFFIGTGWMEDTSMFYGHYYNRTFQSEDDESGYTYNMGLAYIMAIGVTFVISFILILINSSHSVKDTVMDNQDQSSVHFTNSVLCGWDYCIFDERTAKNKKNILLQEFKGDLLEQIKRIQRQNRTNRQKLALFAVRIAVNVVVLSILGGALFLIYFTTDKLIELRQRDYSEVILLLIQFLPSLTIVFLNFLIPNFFNSLVKLEDYRPTFELKITLIRTVLLRLSSLGVLTASLYVQLLTRQTSYDCPEEGKNDTKCCGNYRWETPSANQNSSVQCWETYVGQQFYKLALVDFAALIFLTFFVEFPRKIIYDHLKDKIELVGKYGGQEFDIPQNVLDIVYSQTLSWLGTYFAPLLPVMTLLKVFFIFYIKKLTLMRNYAPPQHVYKVSKSNSFFNLILLISFVLVAIIIGYMVGNINPSMSCGPFRLYSTRDYLTWTALTDVISGWPDWASKLFFFFGSTAFFVPCFFVLCLLMYYYWAVGQGYKRMEEILQEQLKLEGKDKQFLLARVNDIIKQGNLQGVTGSLN